MLSDHDPIVAIATAAGRGGVGVVRVSGRQLVPLMEALCGRTLQARHATYLGFRDADGGVIDQGLALFFPAPHSYTGEQVLELQGHGGPVILQMLVRRCLVLGEAMGLRLAEPGEFTRRAFLNDKLDLAQAEAVADLIEASTEAAARSAVHSLSGMFSGAIRELVDAVISLRMLLEATLDFPEEEIEFLQQADARGQIARLLARLDAILDRSRQGALLREGLNVVLAGRPNVGKSSLLNALAQAEVAIVTAIPGTTRDKVMAPIQIEGIRLHIIDTAGLRDTDDEVERIGIKRTWDEIERADVIVNLRDAGEPATPEDEVIAARLPARVPRLTVYNKIDLCAGLPRVDGQQLYLSARSGAGIDLLRAALLNIAGWHSSGESVYLARERHLRALAAARGHLQQAAVFAEQDDRVLELFAEELRLAQEQLNTITGRFGADQLLGEIFSRFCIGK
jgi:tRNA modification GTPase